MEYARVSRVIAVPADRVWTIVRAFADVTRWIVGVSGCVLEDYRDEVGAVRVVSRNGRQVRERLLVRDDASRRLSYAVLPPHSLSAEDVQSTIMVEPIDAATSRVMWFSEAVMDTPDPALTGYIEDFFAMSLAQLEQICRSGAA